MNEQRPLSADIAAADTEHEPYTCCSQHFPPPGPDLDERLRRAIYSVWPGLGQSDTRRLVAALRSLMASSGPDLREVAEATPEVKR